MNYLSLQYSDVCVLGSALQFGKGAEGNKLNGQDDTYTPDSGPKASHKLLITEEPAFVHILLGNRVRGMFHHHKLQNFQTHFIKHSQCPLSRGGSHSSSTHSGKLLVVARCNNSLPETLSQQTLGPFVGLFRLGKPLGALGRYLSLGNGVECIKSFA